MQGTVAGTHEGPCCHPHCTGINIQSDLTHVTARQYAGQGVVIVVRERKVESRATTSRFTSSRQMQLPMLVEN